MIVPIVAAISAFIAVTQFHPDVIVNAGTAGGFGKYGAAIGDAWIGTQFFNHDRRIPIPGFDVYGKGGYAAFPTPNLVSVRCYSNVSPCAGTDPSERNVSVEIRLQDRHCDDVQLLGPQPSR